jgi:hypothetical protein
MPTVSVKKADAGVAFEIRDELGQNATFVFDRHRTTALIVAALKALSELPAQGGELAEQAPIFQGYPRYQIAASEDGDLAVLLQIEPLPVMYFLFDDEAASNLVNQAKDFLSIPRDLRFRDQRH